MGFVFLFLCEYMYLCDYICVHEARYLLFYVHLMFWTLNLESVSLREGWLTNPMDLSFPTFSSFGIRDVLPVARFMCRMVITLNNSYLHYKHFSHWAMSSAWLLLDWPLSCASHYCLQTCSFNRVLRGLETPEKTLLTNHQSPISLSNNPRMQPNS